MRTEKSSDTGSTTSVSSPSPRLPAKRLRTDSLKKADSKKAIAERHEKVMNVRSRPGARLPLRPGGVRHSIVAGSDANRGILQKRSIAMRRSPVRIGLEPVRREAGFSVDVEIQSLQLQAETSKTARAEHEASIAREKLINEQMAALGETEAKLRTFGEEEAKDSPHYGFLIKRRDSLVRVLSEVLS